jgi:hypothetical protein
MAKKENRPSFWLFLYNLNADSLLAGAKKNLRSMKS